MTIRLRCPGKLMLAGEYSVLHPDGRALAVAVPGGLAAELEPAERWELHRPELDLRWTVNQSSPPEDLRYAAKALEVALDAMEPSTPHTITITASFAPGEPKVGVGGSASAAVLAVAAVLVVAGRSLESERNRVASLAHDAHALAQGGRGSGYDVSTITEGGLVETHRRDGRPLARQIPWPEGLLLVGGFCGESASTTRQLKKLEALERRAPQRTHDELAELARPVSQLCKAMDAGATSEILDTTRAAHAAVARWDKLRGLGIITESMAAMVAMAEAEGAAAKVSGAGAGDSVIALCDTPDVASAVKSAWAASGFTPLEIRLCQGVHRIA